MEQNLTIQKKKEENRRKQKKIEQNYTKFSNTE